MTVDIEVFEWDDMYEIGYADIDNEHKNLFRAINRFIQAATGDGCDDLDVVLKKMEGYAAEHFAKEERLMELSGYSGAKDHKLLHKQFWDDLEKFKSNKDAGNDVSLDVAFYTSSWLRHHILNVDMNMGLHLRNNDLCIPHQDEAGCSKFDIEKI